MKRIVELLAYSEAVCYYNLLQYHREPSLTLLPSDCEHEGRELSHLHEHECGSHPVCIHKPHVRTPKMNLCREVNEPLSSSSQHDHFK